MLSLYSEELTVFLYDEAGFEECRRGCGMSLILNLMEQLHYLYFQTRGSKVFVVGLQLYYELLLDRLDFIILLI